MKKRCELCKSIAMIYCDSDNASLCWSCDAKVHSANFLVARHSRNLLCQICHSPTPWTASGKIIGPTTASICGKCVLEDVSDDDREERVEGNDTEIVTDSYEIELVDENDNNHVVFPPPPACSSSSSGEFSICGHGGSLKRKRWNVPDLNLELEEEIDSSTVNINRNTTIGDETTSFQSSESTVGKLKRIRHRNPISGNGRSAPASKILKKSCLRKSVEQNLIGSSLGRPLLHTMAL